MAEIMKAILCCVILTVLCSPVFAQAGHPFIKPVIGQATFNDGTKLGGRPDLIPSPSKLDKGLRIASYGAAAFDIVSTKIAIDRGATEAIYRNSNGGVRWGVAIPAKLVPLIIADVLEHKGYRKQARIIRISQIAIGVFAGIWNLAKSK